MSVDHIIGVLREKTRTKKAVFRFNLKFILITGIPYFFLAAFLNPTGHLLLTIGLTVIYLLKVNMHREAVPMIYSKAYNKKFESFQEVCEFVKHRRAVELKKRLSALEITSKEQIDLIIEAILLKAEQLKWPVKETAYKLGGLSLAICCASLPLAYQMHDQIYRQNVFPKLVSDIAIIFLILGSQMCTLDFLINFKSYSLKETSLEIKEAFYLN